MFIVTENEVRYVFVDNMKAGSIFTTAIYQQVDPSIRNIALNFDRMWSILVHTWNAWLNKPDLPSLVAYISHENDTPQLFYAE